MTLPKEVSEAIARFAEAVRADERCPSALGPAPIVRPLVSAIAADLSAAREGALREAAALVERLRIDSDTMAGARFAIAAEIRCLTIAPEPAGTPRCVTCGATPCPSTGQMIHWPECTPEPAPEKP